MSYAEYAKVVHPRPYVLDIRQGTGHFIYFGTGHTHDASDPQLRSLRRLWEELKPEVVLNEDGPRLPLGTLKDSVERDGEGGALAFWAKEDGIPNLSLDMTREQEVSELRKSFPAAELKTFYALRSFQELSRRPEGARGNRTPEQIVSANLFRAAANGLIGGPSSAAELDAIWPSLKMPHDWRKPESSWFDPGLSGAGTVLNRIATASSEIRDQYMVDRIVEWVASGKRVLAVEGASHVVMQEQAIHKALPKARISGSGLERKGSRAHPSKLQA